MEQEFIQRLRSGPNPSCRKAWSTYIPTHMSAPVQATGTRAIDGQDIDTGGILDIHFEGTMMSTPEL